MCMVNLSINSPPMCLMFLQLKLFRFFLSEFLFYFLFFYFFIFCE